MLEAGGLRLMIDCGLFQERPFLSRNWEPSPIDPTSIDALLLTHAHLDHCGLIPKLVREGYRGPIYCTAPTLDLARLVLEDSARIQEEDAAYKKRRHEREHRRGPHPELPLYTVDDAQRALDRFTVIDLETPLLLNNRVRVRYCEAGHILGSAMVEITILDHGHTKRVLYSGDIGLWRKPLIHDPTVFDSADVVIMESTYGNRDHEVPERVDERLAEIVTATARRGGHVIIPTFAIDRAQELLYHFSNLLHQRRIPPMQVFLDSPMAVDATDVYVKHQRLLDADTQTMLKSGRNPFEFPGMKFVQTVQESRAINNVKMPSIIMAGAGMCTGGRIKHHLSQHLSQQESTVLFVGYQAVGTLGREILEGRSPVRIHGRMHQVRARIEKLNGLSAHADRSALLYWLKQFKTPPKRVFLTHGEETASTALAETVRNELGWALDVPEYLSTFALE